MTRRSITHLEKTLNIWAIILIIWSLYRAKFGTSFPIWIDELVFKPIVFITPIYYFIKRVEKKNFFEGLGLTKKNILKEIGIGLLMGIIFITILACGFLSQNSFKNPNIFKSLTLISFLYFLIISFATSFSEEILSRGFVLTRILEKYKNIYLSSFFAAILYFVIHIPILFSNTMLNGALLLSVGMTDLILGFLLSLIFIFRKNLIIPIFIHTFYNLFLYFLI